jgi:oxygen-independent coproporphyrinogen III oxidase
MVTPRDIGLYIHIPFCRQRCHFCAFYLEVARADRMENFCAALAQEVALCCEQGVMGERSLRSIYFGGGTPTVLPVQKLSALLRLICTTWPSKPDAEITVEAHPSTVTDDDVQALADAGFTRISFGAESMDDDDFKPIGRPGSVRDTERAVTAARRAGFRNINLDVMYGLPGQSLASWMKTLESLLSLNPTHISCYALTIEPDTTLARDLTRHLVPALDETLQIEMESAAEGLLSEAGFTRYEISNYAKPGWASRHNLLYWTGQDYLGLGPSAQSYVDGIRFGNLANLTAYLDHLSHGTLPVDERTVLSASEQQRDALVFGLRLVEGVPGALVDTSLVTADSRARLSQLMSQGLLESTANRLRLTSLGQRYADTVAGQLF